MTTYLVTGGSGTFGSAYIRHVLSKPDTRRVVSLARGEHRQAALAAALQDARLETWIGDVRDRDRVRWAFRWTPDVVVHCAALKRIETCEHDPDEARKTNIDGTRRVISEAILADVPRVLVISSDKAAAPETLYGHTKAAAEALAIGATRYVGRGRTRIAVARYGNVLGSQGSVLEAMFTARATGVFEVTDPEATRFWWSVEEAVSFVDAVLQQMQGGEIWVPKLHSAKVTDLVQAIAPEVRLVTVGMRGQEKRHESMIAASETAYDLGDCYLVLPRHRTDLIRGQRMPDGFTYTSADAPSTVRFEALTSP